LGVCGRSALELVKDERVRVWLEEGIPSEPPRPLTRLPAIYVERAMLQKVVNALVGLRGYREPLYRAVVLYGGAGFGKTTIAMAIVEDERVSAYFRHGIIWLEGDKGTGNELLRNALKQIGVKANDGDLEVLWQEEAGGDDKVLLVIVDDLVNWKAVTPLVKYSGRQVCFLITTQIPDEIRLELEKWLGPEKVKLFGVTGWPEDEGLKLVERVLARPLVPGEKEKVIKLGDAVGWHPEALRILASEARENGWDAILQEVLAKEIYELSSFKRVIEVIKRGLQRLDERQKKYLEKLLEASERGSTFGVTFARAVWGKDEQEAKIILGELTRRGVLESVTASQQEWWDKDRWRIMPMVRQVMRRHPRSMRWWKRHQIASELQSAGKPRIVIPWQFFLISSIVLEVALIFKLLLWVFRHLCPLKAVIASARRIEVNLISGDAEDMLKALWEQKGISPPEELWMVYSTKKDILNWVVVIMWICVIILGITPLISELSSSTSLTSTFQITWIASLAFALIVALIGSWYVAWKVWVAYLYGVSAWDLRFILRLAKLLGMQEPILLMKVSPGE